MINIIDVPYDGNCYMYCISKFIYDDIKYNKRVRNEVANYLLSHHLEYQNINIPSEDGEKNILDYIKWMRNGVVN